MPDPSAKSPQPVWSKRVGDASAAGANIGFCAGYDVAGRNAADSRLAPFDLETNAAHVLMLVEESVIPAEEGSAIAQALLKLRARLTAGEDLLRPDCEDIHMSLETLVGEIVGPDPAGHMHTARSRNDQVATDMRLWLREEVASHAAEIAWLADAVATHARAHANTVCPGFTHGQPAMVTSWGHWTMSYLPRFLRDVRQQVAILRELKTCPLGAAASFGTSWPINRTRAAELLGFSHPTPSGADGIWSRGELELRFAQSLAQFLAHLAGISQDIIMLSSPPREWLRLADVHVTGSSIMPQKRNPDFAEVTRARAAVAAGIVQSLLSITGSLPSGYNRDTQWTKYLAFDAADNARGAAALFADVFKHTHVNAAAMREACRTGFLNATDVADHLARSRRLPFRRCYRIIGAAVRACDAAGVLSRDALNAELEKEDITLFTESEWKTLDDPAALLSQRRQPGNPHPGETARSIDLLISEIHAESAAASEHARAWRIASTSLWKRLTEMAGA